MRHVWCAALPARGSPLQRRFPPVLGSRSCHRLPAATEPTRSDVAFAEIATPRAAEHSSAVALRFMQSSGKPSGRTVYTLPPEVEMVLHNFRTCEFSTLARDGAPQTWPTIAFHEHDDGRFLITTSVGLPQKAYNVRRNGRVSLLFSDPTASGIPDPATVLVQGDAVCPDRVTTALEGFEDKLAHVFRWQPASGMYSSNAIMRRLFDWYYMRLSIYVTPRRILYWPNGELSRPPLSVEVTYVA